MNNWILLVLVLLLIATIRLKDHVIEINENLKKIESVLEKHEGAQS